LLPFDNFRVEKLTLAFDDLAVRYGFHIARTVRVQWSTFDNFGRTRRQIPEESSLHLPAAAADAQAGSYFVADVDAPAEPLKPVSVYIRKQADGYKVVGVERAR
jgi:hypothetical protein